jgi:hypothetical protein
MSITQFPLLRQRDILHSFKRSLEKPKRPLQVVKSSHCYRKTVLSTLQVFKYDLVKNGTGGGWQHDGGNADRDGRFQAYLRTYSISA